MTNKIILPGKPISVNDLYTGRRFLTKIGRNLKSSMGWQVKAQWKNGMLMGNVGVMIDLYYSDNRKRDIDNPTKALLDSMTQIVFGDDSQITELKITKNVGEDRAEITIYEREN